MWVERQFQLQHIQLQHTSQKLDPPRIQLSYIVEVRSRRVKLRRRGS
jgi:hypothetical protein